MNLIKSYPQIYYFIIIVKLNAYKYFSFSREVQIQTKIKTTREVPSGFDH